MKGGTESAAAIAALLSQISDRTLVQFIADGDKAALKLLYLRHSARLYGFVLSQGRRRSEGPLDRHAQDLIADASDGPATLNERRWRRHIPRKCITRLTPIHREVVNLVSYQGKKVEDVAQTPGVPVSTIKARLYYARGHTAKLFAAAGIHRAWTTL
jgi:DNA-directed RNA polymerase specialized sigma24 family protein